MNTSLRPILFSVLSATLTISAGCVESTDSAPVEPAAVSSTHCGEQSWTDVDGETRIDREIYRFAVLDRDLAEKPDVAASIGFSTVTSCAQARTASRALLAASEGRPLAAIESEPTSLTASRNAEPASLMGGDVVSARRGVVEISAEGTGCTGFLANANVVVTAAHCVAHLVGENDSGWGSITVRYFDPTYDRKVEVTSGAETLNVYIHPNWAGGDYDPEDDLAVIVRGTRWNNTTDDDYLRIYNDDFGKVRTMRVFGRGADGQAGTGTGVLRTTTFNVDWYNSWYSITVAASARRHCKGDSGGPAVKEIPGEPGFDLVTGVWVSMEINNSQSRCTRERGDQRYTRLHPTKIAWLEDVTGANCPTRTINDLKYAQCW